MHVQERHRLCLPQRQRQRHRSGLPGSAVAATSFSVEHRDPLVARPAGRSRAVASANPPGIRKLHRSPSSWFFLKGAPEPTGAPFSLQGRQRLSMLLRGQGAAGNPPQHQGLRRRYPSGCFPLERSARRRRKTENQKLITDHYPLPLRFSRITRHESRITAFSPCGSLLLVYST